VWAPRTATRFMKNTGTYVLKVHGMTYKASRRISIERLIFFGCSYCDGLLRTLMIRNNNRLVCKTAGGRLLCKQCLHALVQATPVGSPSNGGSPFTA
jgi:hypothetical protein